MALLPPAVLFVVLSLLGIAIVAALVGRVLGWSDSTAPTQGATTKGDTDEETANTNRSTVASKIYKRGVSLDSFEGEGGGEVLRRPSPTPSMMSEVRKAPASLSETDLIIGTNLDDQTVAGGSKSSTPRHTKGATRKAPPPLSRVASSASADDEPL